VKDIRFVVDRLAFEDLAHRLAVAEGHAEDRPDPDAVWFMVALLALLVSLLEHVVAEESVDVDIDVLSDG